MASNKIVDKIIAKAEEEAAAIRRESEDKIAAIKADYDVKTKKQAAKIAAKEAADSADAGHRSDLMARLEGRKIGLAEKRSVIDEAFAKAGDALAALSDDKWAVLITKIVTQSVETGKETLAVPAADLDKYQRPFGGGKSMLERLNEALVAAGKAGELTLADQAAPFDNGVMILGEKSDVNGSFDVLLDNVRDGSEREVADILFGKEEV